MNKSFQTNTKQGIRDLNHLSAFKNTRKLEVPDSITACEHPKLTSVGDRGNKTCLKCKVNFDRYGNQIEFED